VVLDELRVQAAARLEIRRSVLTHLHHDILASTTSTLPLNAGWGGSLGWFCHARRVEVDLLFDPFGVSASEVLAGAYAAGEAGFGGVWLYDHLAGSVHGRDRVLECWTTLTAIATRVPRIMVGPLVLNVANRPAGTLAAMAATLQELSGGRLLLGIGAGGGRDTPYAAEQKALGREVLGDARRRAAVAEQAATLRAVWRGQIGSAGGFLRPEPLPPVVVGGFGPKMAALAGAVGEGVNLPGGPGLPALLDVARSAHAEAGGNPARFLVTVSAPPNPSALDHLEDLGVHRAVVFVGPPFEQGVSSCRPYPQPDDQCHQRPARETVSQGRLPSNVSRSCCWLSPTSHIQPLK
jgi:alkanesulfonate monooxygenase SsuD/methylene tetrahydromethanopterin reductase-like flavin-dependent oxidoreductase (luciferase family)